MARPTVDDYLFQAPPPMSRHLCTLGTQVLHYAVEGHNLCWAHEGEVERVEEQDHVFALVVLRILSWPQHPSPKPQHLNRCGLRQGLL